MREQLRSSIEQTITKYLDQREPADRSAAIRAAAEEIVEGLLKPLGGRPNLADALDLIQQIDLILRCPAAEYVPAIGDVFKLIDEFKKKG